MYDIGTTVSQLARQLSPKAAERLSFLTVDLKDLLCGILNHLSKIRGSQSHLFSALIQQSQGLLLEDVPQSLGLLNSTSLQGQRQTQGQNVEQPDNADCSANVADLWASAISEQGQVIPTSEPYLADRVEDMDASEAQGVVYS